MKFIDITIVPVSNLKKEAYLEFSRKIADIYREYGALRIVDTWQSIEASKNSDFHAHDALKDYEPGTLPDFSKLSGALDGETVVVTITEWPNREVRDLGTKAATSDPRVQATVDEEPVFDGKRLIAGGFNVEMDLK